MTEQPKKRKTVYNPEADKRWREKNPDRARYLTDRTSARRFIKKRSKIEDLDELEALIADRRKELENA